MKIFSIMFPLYDPNDVLAPLKSDMEIMGAKDNLVDNDDDKDEDDEKEEKDDDENLIVDDDEDLEIEDDVKDKEDKEDDKDDELDLSSNDRNIDFKALKEKYPELAKTNEFRELRNSYYREGKYTELFPTVEDATEAAENNQTFLKLNNEILNEGSVGGLLEAVKEANPDALKKVAGSFLDTLNNLDTGLYIQAITPVVKRVARNMYADGMKILKRNKDDDSGKAIVATARNIMQHYFDDPDLVETREEDDVEDAVSKKVNEKVSEREKALNEREQKAERERFVGALQLSKNSLDKHLDKLIGDNLDPKNVLTDFVKEQIIEKVKAGIEKQVTSDRSHMQRMGKLWEKAKEAGFDKQSLSRIVSAYLERAKPIIPRLRNTYKARAMGRKVVEQDDNRESMRIVRGGKSGRAPENDGKIKMRNVDARKIDYKQTSDADLMSGRVKLRS